MCICVSSKKTCNTRSTKIPLIFSFTNKLYILAEYLNISIITSGKEICGGLCGILIQNDINSNCYNLLWIVVRRPGCHHGPGNAISDTVVWYLKETTGN